MAKFSSPAKQAASVMKQLQGSFLKSVGTVRNYEQALTRVCEWTQKEKISNGLRAINPELAVRYLEQRGQSVGQSTLNMERQAMQAMMRHVTGQLNAKETLPVIQSKDAQVLEARAYSAPQIALIAASQAEKNALSTKIAYSAGLRAHELYTLRPIAERAPDVRPTLDTKFQGREGEHYTVVGKGGLCREVVIPTALAARLEALRLDTPAEIKDRGVDYQLRYAINGGNRWSSSFTTASSRALGWSTGAHGLRHTYGQERMSELQNAGLTRSQALETVSQEMGHFRPDITEVYLR